MNEFNAFHNRIKDLCDDREFVLDIREGIWHSHAEIFRKACNLAERFEALGSKKIALVMENGMDLFLSYFAAMLSYVTILPIDPQKSENEIGLILKDYEGIPVLRNDNAIFESPDTNFEEDCLIKRLEAIDLDREFMITFTSGSTGIPKGVLHTLRNLFLTADSFGHAVSLGSDHVMCHVMPMTYMAGILNTIIMPFLRGCKIVLLPRFDVMSAVSFWKSVKAFGINSFWLSPTMLNVLMAIDKKGHGKEALEGKEPLFFIGTAPLYEEVRKKFEALYEVKLLQSYGLSETLFLSTEIPGKESDTAAVGYLLPEVKLTFADDGEILIDVPWMFLGYSNDDTQSYFKGNSYCSGDLGIVKGGVLFLTGRKKDLIIKGGMNISPRQIEVAILKSNAVTELAVVGVKSKEEERIVCFYVPADNGDFDEASINKLVEAECGKHCRIDHFQKVPEIPKNLNGKADKKALLKDFKL